MHEREKLLDYIERNKSGPSSLERLWKIKWGRVYYNEPPTEKIQPLRTLFEDDI